VDDGELVRSARSNDLDAASTLLARYQNVAYTAALRLVGEPAEAEDVTQEALVRAYVNIGSLDEGASFPNWLRRIAVNLSLNVLRRRGLIRFESLESPAREGRPIDLVDEAPSPELRALASDERETLEALVRRLPAEQRVAVVLRDMYGYDMNDVAAIGRCKLSAAKMRVKRGREALRVLASEVGLGRPPGAA
jgi:RNA polymerase sigma-70 factor (ECF subfamily)